MAILSDSINTQLLSEVKTHLGITVDDPDVNKSIQIKIVAVVSFLETAGANITKLVEGIEALDERVSMCIAIGVNDLLNNEAGETKFSPAFNMLAMQVSRG